MEVSGNTLDQMLTNFGVNKVDFLKMNIEGGLVHFTRKWLSSPKDIPDSEIAVSHQSCCQRRSSRYLPKVPTSTNPRWR